MNSASLISVKDGKPLSFVAAVNVVVAVSAYLEALDQRRLDTTKQLEDMRKAEADYRECIQMNARYKK